MSLIGWNTESMDNIYIVQIIFTTEDRHEAWNIMFGTILF